MYGSRCKNVWVSERMSEWVCVGVWERLWKSERVSVSARECEKECKRVRESEWLCTHRGSRLWEAGVCRHWGRICVWTLVRTCPWQPRGCRRHPGSWGWGRTRCRGNLMKKDRINEHARHRSLNKVCNVKCLECNNKFKLIRITIILYFYSNIFKECLQGLDI